MPEKENSLVELLEQSQSLIVKLQQTIKDLVPSAEFGKAVIADERFYTMKETADILKETLLEDKSITIGRNKLFAMLRDMGILSDYKSNWNEPYRKFIDSGHFHLKVKETPVGMMSVTMVTGKGLEYIQTKVMEYVDEMGL
jgi:phage antirepressor YoqD-like protein